MARWVRLSSISYAGVGSGENRRQRALKRVLELIDKAAWDRPDFIALPETFMGLGCGTEEWLDAAETIPGPTSDALGARAATHGCHILCPVLERRGADLYNSCALIGRDGGILGTYSKIHPTIGEIEKGIRPGTEPFVFSTDVGDVGVAICFDLNFRDVIEGLASGGVEVVFFPSMYRGGLQLRIWAFDYAVWVVSSTPGENSVILDPLGQVLVQSFSYCPVISQRVNLDSAVLHIDYNHEKFDAIKGRYGSQVRLDVLAPEAVSLISCDDPARTVQDIIREFGLEVRGRYFERASRERDAALKNRSQGGGARY